MVKVFVSAGNSDQSGRMTGSPSWYATQNTVYQNGKKVYLHIRHQDVHQASSQASSQLVDPFV
jgi:hypothetical protein